MRLSRRLRSAVGGRIHRKRAAPALIAAAVFYYVHVGLSGCTHCPFLVWFLLLFLGVKKLLSLLPLASTQPRAAMFKGRGSFVSARVNALTRLLDWRPRCSGERSFLLLHPHPLRWSFQRLPAPPAFRRQIGAGGNFGGG